MVILFCMWVLDKEGNPDKDLSRLSTKTYVVGTHQKQGQEASNGYPQHFFVEIKTSTFYKTVIVLPLMITFSPYD